MKTTYRRPPKLAGIICAVAAALGLSSTVESGPLTLATEPLGTATSSIKPNVMFILDDSGSMEREYMPDYVMAPSVPDPALVGLVPPRGQLIRRHRGVLRQRRCRSFPGGQRCVGD